MSENTDTAENTSPVETDTVSVDVPESDDNGREDVDIEQYKAKIHKANSEAKNLRQRLRETEAKLATFEEPEKGVEAEKEAPADNSSEKLYAAEQRAVEAENRLVRLEVAHEKGLTAAQAKRLLGSTREELETDADELLEAFKTSGSGRTTRTHRPSESLKTGREPDDVPEEPTRTIVDRVNNRRRR